MIARYENAQNMRFSGQSFLWFQICEYSEGLSRYFVACQSLRVYHDVSSGLVFHPFFCPAHDCHRVAGPFTFARYLFPPNVATCLPVPLVLPFRVVPLARVRTLRFQPAPPFILLKASGAVRKEEKTVEKC